MSQGAAIRRRRQWAHGFKNLAPLKRPIYHQTSEGKARRKLMRVIEKQKTMQSRKARGR